jgi:hypothetical protein
MLNEDELYHIGEILDDLSYIFQSIEFIKLLEELDKKYPKAQLSQDKIKESVSI